jgi:hypothetical protein
MRRLVSGLRLAAAIRRLRAPSALLAQFRWRQAIVLELFLDNGLIRLLHVFRRGLCRS